MAADYDCDQSEKNVGHNRASAALLRANFPRRAPQRSPVMTTRDDEPPPGRTPQFQNLYVSRRSIIL